MRDVQNIEAALKLRIAHGMGYMVLPIAGTTKVIERRTFRFYDGEWITTVYSAVIDMKGIGDNTVSCRFLV